MLSRYCLLTNYVYLDISWFLKWDFFSFRKRACEFKWTLDYDSNYYIGDCHENAWHALLVLHALIYFRSISAFI